MFSDIPFFEISIVMRKHSKVLKDLNGHAETSRMVKSIGKNVHDSRFLIARISRLSSHPREKKKQEEIVEEIIKQKLVNQSRLWKSSGNQDNESLSYLTRPRPDKRIKRMAPTPRIFQPIGRRCPIKSPTHAGVQMVPLGALLRYIPANMANMSALVSFPSFPANPSQHNPVRARRSFCMAV